MKAYVLEEKVGGEFVPYELMVETWSNVFDDWEDDRFKVARRDMWCEERLEEFPDTFVCAGDDWAERLGVMLTDRDCDEAGGVVEGRAVVNECNERLWDFRIRRVEVSGRPSSAFAAWLAEHPEVKWETREWRR